MERPQAAARRDTPASIESKAGNSPPHRSSTTLSGEADTTGVAILPRNRVRTSWNGTGHLYRSSRVRTCSSLAGIGLVYFVIGHTFGIWQAFGDALPGLAVAPGWQRHIDDRPSSPGNANV